MHDHIIIKEELSSTTLPTTPIIVKQASLECVSVVTSTLDRSPLLLSGHYKFPRYEGETTT